MQLTKNFHIDEFKCKDKNRTPVPEAYVCNVIILATNLQTLRDDLNENRPPKAPKDAVITLPINSGYRTPAYNKSIGGAKNSQHLQAKAGDITCKWLTPKELAARVEKLIKAGKMKDGGLGIYPGFIHYDIGPVRRW